MWRALGPALLTGALDLLWPVTCPGCGQWIQCEDPEVLRSSRHPSRPLLHHRCLAALETAPADCPAPRPFTEGAPVWWAFVDTPGFFAVLHAAKYGQRPDLLEPLARSLASRADLGRASRTILVPLPDDPVRLVERGYSVTGSIADLLARHHEAVVRTDLLVRRRRAVAQAQVRGADARRDNVRGLFGVGRLAEVDLRSVMVLVDDQVTTGSTLAAALRLLGARGHRVLGLALGGAREAPREVVA